MTYNPNTGAEKRKKPFAPKSDYVEVPNAIHRLYTRIPGFTADHALMYIVLMDFYNVEYGYAYPTKWDLAHRLNCGENKPSQLAKLLEECGLIRVKPGGFGRNDIYYVYAPITDEAEFYRRFPEAKARYERRKAGFQKRRANRRSRDEGKTEAGDTVIGYYTDGTPFTARDL
ncbi:helix-turn-helix domain-containing protein [Brevibacillus thermoruber]|uniref:helix-turn-helix domain-containing protein n=1 Tax=Brevibacillus thermoruber TaxID=33942 RepID=UPI00040FC202|nr:helix-turn-helix domain-containing protein [Brevibacillus thermoruber]